MRLGLTLTRTGDTWQVKHLPSVPLGEQLNEFKSTQAAGNFDADETLVVSLRETLKRHIQKQPMVLVSEISKPKKK